MSGKFISNTPRHQMHALAFQGIVVSDCFYQLQDLVARKLGKEYALLFAEPSSNNTDQSVDWYTSAQGTVRPMQALSPEEQHALKARLEQMAGNIRVLIATLQASKDQSRVTQGHILELALKKPDDKCLYVVGEQPVFICWGFGPGTLGAEPQDLFCISAPAVVAAPVAAAEQQPDPVPAGPAAEQTAPLHVERTIIVSEVVERRSGCLAWLWWLLPLLLLLLLLWLLFTSFGGRPALGGRAFFAMPLPPFCQTSQDSLVEEIGTLGRELDTLRARLEAHMAQCRPGSPKDAAAADSSDGLVISPARFIQGKIQEYEVTPPPKTIGVYIAWLCYLLKLFVKFVLTGPGAVSV